MSRLVACGGFLALLVVSARLVAEQEVTLRSGATLIGEVTLDGDAAVVKIDDAELRVPLKEVASVAAVNSGRSQQARRLLVTALEARLLTDAGKEVLGLLGEASRLAPDDPHVNFWYAHVLADAGFGKAAKDVFEPRRAAIAEAYPGLVDKLADRIERRVKLEGLPPALVDRIDQINAAAPHYDPDADDRPVYVRFRLVDQHDAAVPRSAFRVESNGHDEKLESFADGYYLYTFLRSRHNSDEPCRVEVVQPGLEMKTFEVAAAFSEVVDGGLLVVQRFDEQAKRPMVVRVEDAEGKPVAGATVSLQATSDRGTSGDEEFTAQTDEEGVAEVRVFPMRYYYRVAAAGFNGFSDNITLTADRLEDPRKVVLYRQLSGSVRVAWQSSATGGVKTSGDSILSFGQRPITYGYNQDPVSWLRPMQVKDGLSLQIVDTQFNFGPGFGSGAEPWVRVMTAEQLAHGDQSPRQTFDQINLDEIDQYKEKLDPPAAAAERLPGRGPMNLPAEDGAIYLGKIVTRDMRNGQPLELAFKALVESGKKGEEQQKAADEADPPRP